MDFTWVTSDDANAIQNAIVDAKGDLITATAADTPARLAVGTNGQLLTADSTAATGLAWTTVSGGFPAFTTFTPTVTAASGSITTYTANGRYALSGKTCVASYLVDLTNVGTASGTMNVTLPVAAKTTGNVGYVGTAHENNNTGLSGYANIYSGQSQLLSRNSQFGTWFSNGNRLVITVVYEVD